MFRNKLIVICCLLVAGGSSLINGQVQPMMPMDASKIMIPALADKEEVVSTTTSTTTTVAPTTTTPAPPKPTAAPTTTTTSAPDTTTVGPVTTPSPNPVPIPEPPMGRWNTTCILLQMATQLNFTYATADNKTARAIYNIPASATLHDVNCESNNTQEIVLNWGPEKAIHSIAIYFERNNTNVNVHTIMVTLPIDAEEFVNPKANQSVQLIYRGDIFEAPSHMSYHCTRPQIFNVTETINETSVIGTIRLSDVQMEAFRSDNSTSFSSARDCDSSETPDIVPIAVGIALVALILIVLVSYLCARRRSTARGYMSF
ncbi:lysosome-associated membrane glycoprotein 1 [Episyrphus balteatus]|uniref:lysosome-associated membrane glycoprotein 1 n=1 Tax=Episyrphus balteatus TaxID=286459 RepID=UPI002486280F|nr:lysosome-associated membrane glycoprotein 1 [Episyrphus balteatus]